MTVVTAVSFLREVTMKRILFSALFLSSVFLISKYFFSGSDFNDLSSEQLSDSLNAHQKVVGQTVNPNHVLYTLEGEEVRLSDFVGKPLVVMYWAPWCKACKEQLPEMIRAQQALPHVNFAYIVVNSDNEAIAKWQTPATKDMKIYRKGWKQGESILTGNALPLTYVVDESGTVLDEQLGFNTNTKLNYIYNAVSEVDTIAQRTDMSVVNNGN